MQPWLAPANSADLRDNPKTNRRRLAPAATLRAGRAHRRRSRNRHLERPVFAARHRLLSLVRAPLEEVAPAGIRKAAIERRFLATVRQAATVVPFHRRRFAEHGVRASEIQSLADLHKLPLSSAADLRGAAPNELLAEGTRRGDCRYDRSTGSSGDGLFELYLDRRDQADLDAIWLRSYWHMGLRPHLRSTRIEVVDPDTHFGPMTATRRILRLPTPQRISALLPIDEQIALLRQQRPELIASSPSRVMRLVRGLIEQQQPLLGVDRVLVGGEPLYADCRDEICRWLGSDVRMMYGTTETGFVAFECERGTYHVNDDHVLCEVLSDGADGVGNLAVTTLQRRVMPQIRFLTGDVVRPRRSGCACGSPLPPLGELVGRTSSFLRLPSGHTVAAQAAAAVLGPLGGSDRFQLRQDGIDLEVLGRAEVLPSTAAAARVRVAIESLTEGELAVRVAVGPSEVWRSDAKHVLVKCLRPPAPRP